LRQDVVSFVHDQLSKNSRQAHGVDNRAGLKHSAVSWGTGRAVARIPRIQGSGTHRSGQGAYGNMCRKGHMAFPLHVWRRWHRKVNLNQKRHALASSLAATTVLPLVQARGHRVNDVPQLPLVLDNEVNKIQKTKDAVALLQRFGCYEDVERVQKGKIIRAGKSKARGNRYRQKKGPLFVVDDDAQSLVRALRNIPGVDTIHVSRLNIRLLAPGGQLGRFTVFTQGAISKLGAEFGNVNGGSLRKGYRLRREVLSNPDISAIINSDEIQSILKDKKKNVVLHPRQKKNPLKNKDLMDKLNPFQAKIRTEKKKKIVKDKKKGVDHKKRV
jgi:large subunit ribosomal protein L4e